MTGTGIRRGHRVRRALGDLGERLAAEHLQAQGYEVLDRNWRCAHGEIDLVARDGSTLVVCEVKTRRSSRYGAPHEAVTRAKAARLRRLAVAWLRAHGGHPARLRIDVISVRVGHGEDPELEHLRAVA